MAASAFIITPDGKLVDIGQAIHGEYYRDHLYDGNKEDFGVIKYYDYDGSEDWDDDESISNALDHMIDKGYSRTRYAGGYKIGDKVFDFGIDDNHGKLPINTIEDIILGYGLKPSKARFEYNDFEGTLDDYIMREDKRKRQSEMARMLVDPRFYDPESGK